MAARPYGDVYSALEEAAKQLARPINPTILSTKELSKRVANDNAFVSRVLSQPKIWLVRGDDASAFENLCGSDKPLKAEAPDAKEFAD